MSSKRSYFVAVHKGTHKIISSATTKELTLSQTDNPVEHEVYQCSHGVYVYILNFGVNMEAFKFENGMYVLNHN